MTDAAANRVKVLEEENNPAPAAGFITGGGYLVFSMVLLDEQSREDDVVIEKNGVFLVVDPMSLQYLVGVKSITPMVLKALVSLSITRMQQQPVVVVLLLAFNSGQMA